MVNDFIHEGKFTVKKKMKGKKGNTRHVYFNKINFICAHSY